MALAPRHSFRKLGDLPKAMEAHTSDGSNCMATCTPLTLPIDCNLGMPRLLLNLARWALPVGRLCSIQVLLKLVTGRVLELMSSQRGSERGQVFIGFQPTEALGRFHHSGGRPAQRHRGILPSLHVATDAAHGPHHVFD